MIVSLFLLFYCRPTLLHTSHRCFLLAPRTHFFCLLSILHRIVRFHSTFCRSRFFCRFSNLRYIYHHCYKGIRQSPLFFRLPILHYRNLQIDNNISQTHFLINSLNTFCYFRTLQHKFLHFYDIGFLLLVCRWSILLQIFHHFLNIISIFISQFYSFSMTILY
jgi:hypothetical protein